MIEKARADTVVSGQNVVVGERKFELRSIPSPLPSNSSGAVGGHCLGQGEPWPCDSAPKATAAIGATRPAGNRESCHDL